MWDKDAPFLPPRGGRNWLRPGHRDTFGSMTIRHAAALLALLAAACGKDPVSYSAPVGISLDVRSSDDVGGVILVDKNITTEQGNPYGAFTNAAVQKLGRDPSRIEVSSATLRLEPASTNVTALEQVFLSTTRLSFQMNGSNNSYPVASITAPTGAGPVALQVAFDSGAMTPADYASLVGGNFKLALTGAAASGFGTRGATAKLVATLTFVAFE